MNVYYCRFDKLIRFGQSLQSLLTDLETARGIKDERNGRLLQVRVACWLNDVDLGFANLASKLRLVNSCVCNVLTTTYRAGRPIIRKVWKIRIWVLPPVCLGSR